MHVIIEADATSDAVVTLDDQPIGPAAYRTAIPVDPGDHILRATAPGKAPWGRPFHVVQGGAEPTLTVPALEPLSPSGSPASAAPGASTAHEPSPAPLAPSEPSPRAGSGARTLGFAVGGAGIVIAGVGAYFGARAFSDKSAAENGCGATFCTPAGSNATSSMKTDETISTVTVIAGVAATLAGVYLVLSNPSERAPAAGSARISLGLLGSGVRAQASW